MVSNARSTPNKALQLVLFLAIFLGSATAESADEVLQPRMTQFIQEFNMFARAYNSGYYDVRGARRLSKLWRDVETCGFWPAPEGAKK